MNTSKPGKTILTGAAILLIGTLILINGPTVNLDYTITTPDLANDLDQYLIQRESRFADIINGTEKTIIWANPAAKLKTELSVVFIHGFAASRRELSPLIENLAEALNANLFLTRLRGHGRDGNAMLEGTVNHYLNDAVEALHIGKQLGTKTLVIGNSTGATLATWLAYNYPQDVAQLVLVSPNYGPRRHEANLMLLPWGKWILYAVEGRQYSFDTQNEFHAKFWTSSFPSEALLPMMGLVKLVTNGPLHRINMPVLVLYDPHDTIVSPALILETYQRFGNQRKHIIAFEHSQDPQHHILAGDILSPDTTSQVQGLILDYLLQAGQ